MRLKLAGRSQPDPRLPNQCIDVLPLPQPRQKAEDCFYGMLDAANCCGAFVRSMQRGPTSPVCRDTSNGILDLVLELARIGL